MLVLGLLLVPAEVVLVLALVLSPPLLVLLLLLLRSLLLSHEAAAHMVCWEPSSRVIYVPPDPTRVLGLILLDACSVAAVERVRWWRGVAGGGVVGSLFMLGGPVECNNSALNAYVERSNEQRALSLLH